MTGSVIMVVPYHCLSTLHRVADARLQVKILAKDIYSQHFRAAQAVPRGVVAKLCAVVRELEAACDKHSCQVTMVHCVVTQ